MMELSEFVEKSLVQIIRGVEAAQEQLGGLTEAEVNPSMGKVFSTGTEGGINLALGWAESGGLVDVVTFDVAVTTLKGKGSKGGIGVVAGAFNLGTSASSDDQHTAASRIQFRVPVKLPRQCKAQA